MNQSKKILLSTKELANMLGRSEKYIYYMRLCGFIMPGGRATIEDAILFLKEHPNPCAEHRKQKK